MCNSGKKVVLSSIAGALTNVRQQSAMNPFLWIIGILGSVFIATFLIPNVPSWIQIFVAILFAIVLLTGVCVGIFFVVKSPSNLRSDEYQTQRDYLNFLEHSQVERAQMDNQLAPTEITTNPNLKED